jgi:tRNA (guanine37-N1)-methyltransferase
LTGGEIPAMIVVDSISRLLSGVLGNSESAKEESHSSEGYLEYPQYTKPEVFFASKKKWKVPTVLLSGNHKKIAEWRKEKSTCLIGRQETK